MSWTVGLASSARRDIDKLPPRVIPAVVEFIYGPLASDPRRIGKPLRENFHGHWSARRGDYRVLYMLDEHRQQIVIIRVGHRSQVYRPG
ncbi:type II toxin-antitoxin system RelE family toxin [Candidatus Mycobacterium methanotrophicum]|uniref:Type II toxin-antitoxin system RelE/ParE family toxin n=1 Tax=Candidatus Mycobacterium methanotrophicum TaxID=2943498 RepID=A0ABY4QQ93_9MYCO|nr:type II toxin-antitoxin system RelE/ParE family toxin [Candidatus Mycobacterium methanotrophicum]UQX12051.1 type II toxin-antitoxin system RelE/ParE family toxin [Candidatus Mycobacterium methanotrophicum]